VTISFSRKTLISATAEVTDRLNVLQDNYVQCTWKDSAGIGRDLF